LRFFLRFFLPATTVAPLAAARRAAMAERREWENRRRRSSNWPLSIGSLLREMRTT
jgi:hypothetical protein